MRVRIKDNGLQATKDKYGVVTKMWDMQGKVFNNAIRVTDHYEIKDDKNSCPWSFAPADVEVLPEPTITRKGDTITCTTENGTYSTTCSKDDTFDAEKGILMALAKAQGYTYKDIKEMTDKIKYRITLSDFLKPDTKIAIRIKTPNDLDKLKIACDNMGHYMKDSFIYHITNMQKRFTKLCVACGLVSGFGWDFEANYEHYFGCTIYNLDEVDLNA